MTLGHRTIDTNVGFRIWIQVLSPLCGTAVGDVRDDVPPRRRELEAHAHPKHRRIRHGPHPSGDGHYLHGSLVPHGKIVSIHGNMFHRAILFAPRVSQDYRLRFSPPQHK